MASFSSHEEQAVIREFLYVDVQRTRSLLAQLDQGVVEASVTRASLDDVSEVGATIFGVGGKGTWGASESREESRSLQDLTFAVFEDAAAAQGIIVDVEASSDPDDWTSGAVHGVLAEGEIVRVTGDLLITDPSYIGARFDALDGFMTALIEMQTQVAVQAAQAIADIQISSLREQLSNASQNQRKQVERQIKAISERIETEARAAVETELGGRSSIDQMKSVMKVVTSFVGEAIAVRVLSCGFDHPEMGFAGSLLGRDDYLQRERDELFSRYGSVLTRWTVVMQIARLPDEADSEGDFDIDPEVLSSGGGINRAAFERAAAQLLRMMESVGISEGPRWPTISVVPLAIYRAVPHSTTTDLEVSE